MWETEKRHNTDSFPEGSGIVLSALPDAVKRVHVCASVWPLLSLGAASID